MSSQPSEPVAAAIIVAAGRGTRLGAPDKILLPLAGTPLLAHSVAAAEAADTVADIIIVAGMHTKATIEQLMARSNWRKVRHVALGGERRQDSVEAGLRLIPDDIDVVAVHDGARPLATAEMFDACIRAAARAGAAITAIPVTDTLKRVVDNCIVETVPRAHLWAAQTPQAFRTQVLRDAFAYATAHHIEVTDEAGLLEALGVAVEVVAGSSSNLKITRPEDLSIAEALLALARKEKPR